MNDSKIDVPILIISCDRYRDLWGPFFYLWRKYWPSCSYPMFLGTNHEICHEPGVSTICIGDDVSWSSGVQLMLDAIRSEYVVVWLEDQFITSPVDDASVIEHLRIGLERSCGFLRMRPLGEGAPPPTRPLAGHPEIGVFDRGAPYRVVMQPALWKVETLRRLLIPGLSPWEFETIGTHLSNQLTDEFLGPYDFVIATEHAVEKGKWRPVGIEICRRAGVEPDLNTRPQLSLEELQSLTMSDGFSEAQIEATLAFRLGRRQHGWKVAARILRNRPRSLQTLLIAVAGTISPRIIDLMERVNVAWRLHGVKRRLSRAVTARGGEGVTRIARVVRAAAVEEPSC